MEGVVTTIMKKGRAPRRRLVPRESMRSTDGIRVSPYEKGAGGATPDRQAILRKMREAIENRR